MRLQSATSLFERRRRNNVSATHALIQILNLVGHAKGALWALTRTAGIFHPSAKVRTNGRTCAYPHNLFCVSLILRCSFISCDAVGLVVRWGWALIFFVRSDYIPDAQWGNTLGARGDVLTQYIASTLLVLGR
jgi:hypothetical protein